MPSLYLPITHKNIFDDLQQLKLSFIYIITFSGVLFVAIGYIFSQYFFTNSLLFTFWLIYCVIALVVVLVKYYTIKNYADRIWKKIIQSEFTIAKLKSCQIVAILYRKKRGDYLPNSKETKYFVNITTNFEEFSLSCNTNYDCHEVIKELINNFPNIVLIPQNINRQYENIIVDGV